MFTLLFCGCRYNYQRHRLFSRCQLLHLVVMHFLLVYLSNPDDIRPTRSENSEVVPIRVERLVHVSGLKYDRVSRLCTTWRFT